MPPKEFGLKLENEKRGDIAYFDGNEWRRLPRPTVAGTYGITFGSTGLPTGWGATIASFSTTPTWTGNNSLLAITTVARLGISRTTFSLNNKWGAYVYVWMGRGGTTALSNGVDIRIRRTFNNGAFYPAGPVVNLRSSIAAAASTTCTASGNPNPAGSTTLTVASTTSFASQDLICIQDNATPTTLTEWAKVSSVTSSTVLQLDAPLINAHNNTGHTVRNKADAWSIWIEGGPGASITHELIIDYGNNAAGDTATFYAAYDLLGATASA